MSTKLLVIISVFFILIAGYFYANNDAKLTQINLKPSDIDYQASHIKALKTNEQGKISYQLTADKVVHYQNAATAVLTEPRVIWQVGNERRLNLSAAAANLNENKQVIQLTGEVKMVSQPLTSVDRLESDITPSYANNDTHIMNIVGRDFVGNLASKLVTSEQPIVVTQANNRFEAQNLHANVETGDYQFQQVSMTIQPSNTGSLTTE